MTEEYRVFGPPGTGKTTWIAGRSKQMAERYGEDQVSICSLTNTAVKEVVGRDLPLPAENVATLHARCKRALHAGAPAESKIGEFVQAHPQWSTDTHLPKDLRRKAARDNETSSEAVLAGSYDPTSYERAQLYRQRLIPMSQWHPSIVAWYEVWADWMQQTGFLDFTGWLEACLSRDVLPPQQVLFVDEAQDHTPLQLEVIRHWPAKYRILVGDDDQALYGFSGASPEAFLHPEISDEREKVLSQSYRVPREVHATAQAWIEAVQTRREKAYLPRDADGSVKRRGFGLADAENGLLPVAALDSEHTVMFLATCGYMLKDVEATLLARGIPFHNPFRKTATQWNPLTTPGIAIESFLAETWLGADVANWASVLKANSEFFRSRRKAAMVRYAEDRATEEVTIHALESFIQPEQRDALARRDLSIFTRYKDPLKSGSWDYAVRCYTARPEEARSPRVIVGTIHSVKGGEADHVYLFPELSRAAYFNTGGTSVDDIRRLFYVGMTRARMHLELGTARDHFAVRF